MSVFTHPLAVVEDDTEIGDGTRIWHFAHVRAGAKIGTACTLGMGVFVDTEVVIGSNVKLENRVSVFYGVDIDDGVFVGPHVCFTNDRYPRAVMPDMTTRGRRLTRTRVEEGVSIGGNATIVAGVTLGRWSMVGAGAVVARDVPPHGLAIGNPARTVAVVARSGEVVARPYRAGVFSTADGAEQVEVLPDWVETLGPRR